MVDEKRVANDKIAKFESDLEGMMTIYMTYPSTQGFPAMIVTKIPEISKAMRRALIEMRKATSMNEAKQQKFAFLMQMTQEMIVIAEEVVNYLRAFKGGDKTFLEAGSRKETSRK